MKDIALAAHLHHGRLMKRSLLAVLCAFSASAFAYSDDSSVTASLLNVNSRYTVESIELAPQHYQLSTSVAEEMRLLVGEHLNVDALNRLSRRMTEELRARSVTFRLYRGAEPAHVRVTFEVEKRPTDFDLSLSSLTFNSREGFTGTAQATLASGNNSLTLAGLRNGDDTVERYSGIRARYDRKALAGGRIALGLEFDAFKNEYDAASLNSLHALPFSLSAGAYRSRVNVEPSATFVLATPLTLTVGLSFERLNPDWQPVGGVQAANATFATLRWLQDWKNDGGASQNLDAIYRFRSSLRQVGSDSLYTKHQLNAKYTYRRNRHMAEVAVMAGVIYGTAPLFERFVLGNNSTLRGWNKYELDPLGGNRAVHASVTYGYQIMRVFYDTGAIWNHGTAIENKNSVGVGMTTSLGMFGRNAVLLAVALPVRRSHVEPVFLAGMNF